MLVDLPKMSWPRKPSMIRWAMSGSAITKSCGKPARKNGQPAVHAPGSEKPLIMTGGGVILSRAAQELTDLARKYRIPVTGTLMGLGSFPASDPLWLGMLGMHGTYYANMAVSHCDLPAGRACASTTASPVRSKLLLRKPKLFISTSIPLPSIKCNRDLPIVGDAQSALTDLLRFLEEHHYEPDIASRQAWLSEIDEWRPVPLTYRQNGEVIKPQFVIQTLHRLTGATPSLPREVGQNQMWTAQFFGFDRPNTFISSGGLEPRASDCRPPSASSALFPTNRSWTSRATAASR